MQEKQVERGLTQDRIHRLKNDVPTRWRSRLGAMSTYITELDNISAVVSELSISRDDVPSIS